MLGRVMLGVGKHGSVLTRSVIGGSLRRTPALAKRLSLLDAVRLRQFRRPAYGYGMMRAAEMASRLGYKEVSAIEFGVAGGNGLLAMEQAAELIEARLPIRFRIWGFDLGSGLPQPLDYRDLPYHWQPAFYRMDADALRQRLTRAKLVLGNVAETVKDFVTRPEMAGAPLGFVSFDLDYYSSTKGALPIFDVSTEEVLPRTFCYFDDIAGEAECYSDRTGVRLAIAEYNAVDEKRVIDRCHDFEALPIERWQEKISIRHDFSHPRYCDYVGKPGNQDLTLNSSGW